MHAVSRLVHLHHILLFSSLGKLAGRAIYFIVYLYLSVSYVIFILLTYLFYARLRFDNSY